MTIPFCYLVKSKITHQFYYGVRYANNCKPSDLWTIYFTSSAFVKNLILLHGKDSFEYEIRKTFTSKRAAKEWEHKVLRRIKASNRVDFINKSNSAFTVASDRIWMNNGKNSILADILDIENLSATGWVRGRIFSEKHKSNISNSVQVRCKDKTKIIGMKNKNHTVESKIKISQGNKGKIPTQEHRNKIADVRGTKVTINGITYRSIREAAKSLKRGRHFIKEIIKTQHSPLVQSNSKPN